MCSMHDASQRLAIAYQKAIINTIKVFIDPLGRSLCLCLCLYILFYTMIFYGIWTKVLDYAAVNGYKQSQHVHQTSVFPLTSHLKSYTVSGFERILTC